jgi:hypothetical protein
MPVVNHDPPPLSNLETELARDAYHCEKLATALREAEALAAKYRDALELAKADREACRRRLHLEGADAQALESALTMTEKERDVLRAEVENTRRMCSIHGADDDEAVTLFARVELLIEQRNEAATERDAEREAHEETRRKLEAAESEVNMANGVLVLANEAQPGEELEDAIREGASAAPIGTEWLEELGRVASVAFYEREDAWESIGVNRKHWRAVAEAVARRVVERVRERLLSEDAWHAFSSAVGPMDQISMYCEHERRMCAALAIAVADLSTGAGNSPTSSDGSHEPVFLPKCPHPEVLGAIREHNGGTFGTGVGERLAVWLADCASVLDGRIAALEKVRQTGGAK